MTTDANIVGSQFVGVTASSADYSDITLHWNAENTAVLDKGGVTGSSTGYDAISYDSSIKAVGSYSMKRTDNYDVIFFSSVSSSISHASGQLGVWIYLNSVSDNLMLVKLSYNNSNDDAIKLIMQGTDDLEFTHTGDNPYVSRTISTTGDTLAADTWYYVVCYWDKSASATNTLVLTIYNSSGSQIDQATSTSSLTNPANAINRLDLGDSSNTAGTFYLDNFMYSNSLTRELNSIKSVQDVS
jgi:hypothetical protein